MHVLTENEVRNLTRRIESGGKFSVPQGTILTPLARDFLRSRSIDIVEDRSAPRQVAISGEPDEYVVRAVTEEVRRALGKDAEPTTFSPTPLAAKAAERAVVWAIGGDRPGILAAVAELLGRRKVNILEISQTILSGVFAMVVIVDIAACEIPFGDLKLEIEKIGRELGINLSAQRDEIFQFMHRI